jgi:hypothetical protein
MGNQLNPPNVATAGQDSPTVASAQINGGASVLCREILIQASNNNTAWCYVGSANSQVIELPPGAAITIPIDNVNKIWHTAASGTQLLNWVALQ